MRANEIVKTLGDKQGDKYCFVKWWRKEEDFLDYDLIGRFLDNSKGSEEFGGIDLLTMDDMWNEVSRVGGSRVTLRHDKDGDKVQWVHKGKTGIRTNVCSYTPETLMEIYDVETKGNPVD